MIKAAQFGKLSLRTYCFQFKLPINYDTEIMKMRSYGECHCHDQAFINWYIGWVCKRLIQLVNDHVYDHLSDHFNHRHLMDRKLLHFQIARYNNSASYACLR